MTSRPVSRSLPIAVSYAKSRIVKLVREINEYNIMQKEERGTIRKQDVDWYVHIMTYSKMTPSQFGHVLTTFLGIPLGIGTLNEWRVVTQLHYRALKEYSHYEMLCKGTAKYIDTLTQKPRGFK